MHAIVERVRPALGQEGILLVWRDEGLGLKAEDFEIERFGEVVSAEDNARLPGRADIWYSGECTAKVGMKAPLKTRPKP
jgi:hypothetical protein